MLKPLLDKVIKPGVSDIHLKANEPPLIRHFGQLNPIGNTSLKTEEIQALIKSILTDAQLLELKDKGGVDCALQLEGAGRLRLNIYRQQGSYAIAIRLIPSDSQSFKDLHLPEKSLENVCRSNRGLIIISGVTGAGKTTTLNSMINYMNENFTYNIITVEDPIEYTHPRKKSSISQREVGRDVPSMSDGVGNVLRQDPDVIVLGEMRTQETFRAAIEGASSGHLVLATVHSSDTMDAVDRIVNSFDSQQQTYLRLQLTNALRAIISQRLVREKYGKGRFPATEILFATLQIKNLLAKGQISEARGLIEQGSAYGMHSFDQDLLRMVEDGSISPQEALSNASKPNDLRIKLQGQNGGGTAALEIMK